jgi:hypothetical protein
MKHQWAAALAVMSLIAAATPTKSQANSGDCAVDLHKRDIAGAATHLPCLARQSLEQTLERKPQIHAPATWKGGHESGKALTNDSRRR